jgi:DNA repair protein RecO (recombination protein O)
MIDKTRGIVLHQIRYAESGIIAWIYTRKFGRQSFMIRGAGNRKKGKHSIFFQPLSILDMIIYFRESDEMHSLKEFSVAYSPSDIYLNIRKTSVAIFLGEVLSSVLREETPNEPLFDFIESSVHYFDSCPEDYANFHIAFLAGLSSYLGFEPSARGPLANKFFDMMNGTFVAYRSGHDYYADEEISAILAQFFSSTYEETNTIILNGTLRNITLDTLVRFYSLHLPGLKKIKSLEVLKEVFS